MGDARGPLAEAAPDADGDVEPGATRPRVVVIVRPRAAAAPTADDPLAEAEAPPSEAAQEPEGAALGEVAGDALEPAPAAEEPGALVGAAAVAAGDRPTARVGLRRPAAGDDQPTERIRVRKRTRSSEDDALVAAVIQLTVDADPSPFSEFLGLTLLERAADAAARSGAPRLILVGRELDPAHRDQALELARRGFAQGPVEVVEEDLDGQHFGRGRVLLLDGSALHDAESVARIARVRGERTALLLGEHGDGLKVRTQEGLVAEVASELPTFDGRLVGACSVPVEDFERITQVGQRAALDELSRDQLLVGVVASDCHGRQFKDRERLPAAAKDCYNDLAGSAADGLFDGWAGRWLSRRLTLALVPRKQIRPESLSLVALILALGGVMLLATGLPGAVLSAALMLVLSTVLDRGDGELARLRLARGPRPLDLHLDALTHALLVLALAWGLASPPADVAGFDVTLGKLGPLGDALREAGVTGLHAGFFGALGSILLLGVLLLRGRPDREAAGLRRIGDLVAGSFNSRDWCYVLLFFAAVNLLAPERGVLGLYLLLSAAVVNLLWAVLVLLHAAAPGHRRA